MSDTYKPLTKEEKEASIRQGIIPAMGQRETIFGVVKNVLSDGFDWKLEGGVLHITHTSGSIQIQSNNQCEFVWTK